MVSANCLIVLDVEILNNHKNHNVCFRDRHTSYQIECQNNYIGVSREIEHESSVDKEHQGNQWALRAFLRQGTTTANSVSDNDASTLHQIKKDSIKVGFDGEITNNY